MKTIVRIVAVILCVTALAPAAGPEYVPVEAKLCRPRQGLGNFFAKLEAGDTVRIAYLGGSITAMNGWRNKTTDWFRSKYPNAKVEEIHAAIGGTGSDLGVFRLQRDVLRHKPDLLFVEFAVNDGGAAPPRIWRAMEGIVRQTWQADPTTDICYVYTLHHHMIETYQKGQCPRSTSSDELLADYYGIPSINFGVRVAELEKDGKLIMTPPDEGEAPEDVIVFSKDGVHPVDAGHEVYLDVIKECMPKIAARSRPVKHGEKLGRPFVEDHMTAAKIVPIQPDMLKGDWKKLGDDDHLAKSFGKRMGTLWEADQPGESIQFKFKGSYAALYDILGPDGGQVTITVDGKQRGPVARFDKYCTYHRIATLRIAGDLDPDKVHEVTVTVHPDQPDRSIVTDREKDKPDFNPKKYDGTNLRIGGVMIIGELVE